MLARQTRTMLMDKLLDLDDTALPEGKQGMMHINLFFMLDSQLLTGLNVALAVFNTLPWARSEVIEVPLDEGLPTMKQYSAFGRTGYAIGKWLSLRINFNCEETQARIYFAVENVPPLGVRGHNFTEETEYEPVKVTTDRNNNIVMENVFIQATFDKSGHLIGLTDKKLKYAYLSYLL